MRRGRVGMTSDNESDKIRGGGPGATPAKTPEGNNLNNVNRFSGFADTYNRYRPAAPELVVQLLTTYLGHAPSTVVDLGCGTGLSSFIWRSSAQQIVGVEPNDGMREIAQETLAATQGAEHISFIPAFSNSLPLASGSVDVVTCSQSFHWMDPVSTLAEVARILNEGGVFAAYDCDWPASVDWRVEQAYTQLIEAADATISRHAREEDLVHKWPKHEHLKYIEGSGHFRFAKEIVFHNTEPCNAARYIGLAISQGGVQTVLQSGWSADIQAELARFQHTVGEHFEGRTLQILFSYRLRMGVK